MPRRDKGVKEKEKGPPLNHPSENYREHRQFLIRSLERNDVDISALLKLNDSLHKAKEKILQTCGELVLLDLGSGRLKLIDDELHEETTGSTKENNNKDHDRDEGTTNQHEPSSAHHRLTPAQKEVCVDFLLRMKLRRKLCNRLIRRLNRVASAMDGNDVSPPAPPRYGDLRLHIDPKEVEARVAEWKRIEEAKKRIEAALKGFKGIYHTFKAAEVTSKDTNTNSSVGNEVGKTGEVSRKDTAMASVKTDENGESVPSTPKPIELDPNDKGNRNDSKLDMTPMVPGFAPEMTATSQESPETKTVSIESEKGKDGSYPTLESDFELLRQYDDAYEKVWDPQTRQFKYTVSIGDGEPEYKEIKNGAGIGSSNRGMTLQDREAEYNRWKSNMFARIPDQPTCEELGLKHRVFLLEERRKRCLEEAAEDSDDGSNAGDHQESPKKPKVEKTLDEEVIENLGKLEEGDHDEATSQEENMNEKDGIDTRKETRSTGEPEKEIMDMNSKRSISFAATPSFHEQDLARIQLIHNDVVKSAVAEQARNHLAAVTSEYNNALHRSTECFNAQNQIQHNLAILIAKGRQELSKIQSDYATEYAKAKQNWRTGLFWSNFNRLNHLLPSRLGYNPEGTSLTKHFIINAGQDKIRTDVGECLADVIDTVARLVENNVVLPQHRDFVPPPARLVNGETAEELAERHRRTESECRSQYNLMNAQFNASEAERSKAWRKMMKAKAELDIPHEQMMHGVRQKIRVTLANFSQIPMPGFRGSANVALPRELARQAAAVAAYRPPTSTTTAETASGETASGENTSKYSADKVRQRKAADGTVAPVSEPKKTKDGLYQRPAGRTRKGMRWDAFAGVWVPQASS